MCVYFTVTFEPINYASEKSVWKLHYQETSNTTVFLHLSSSFDIAVVPTYKVKAQLLKQYAKMLYGNRALKNIEVLCINE